VSRAKSGDLGFYPYDSLEITPPPFPALAVVDMAYARLSVGQADLIEYPFGYAIIKATEISGDWEFVNVDDFIKKSKERAEIKIYIKLD
jgi:hypothetical protein